MLPATRRWRVALSIGAAIAIVIVAPRAEARDEARARLRYQRSAAAAPCLDESEMRDAVAARLGYDPFVGDAADGVVIALDRRDGQWQAQIELEDESGARKGARSLSSRQKSCDELVSAVSLAVALAIDTRHFTSPAPASGPAPTSEPPARSPASESPHTQPEAPRAAEASEARAPGAVAFASGGGFVTGGVVPSFSFGPRLRAGLGWRHASIAVEGVYVAKGAVSSPSGRVEASVLAGGILPCVRFGPESFVLEACGRALFGALFGEAKRVWISTPTTDPQVALGAELAAELPFGKSFGARMYGGALATVTRTFLRIRDDGRDVDVWSSPPFSVNGGVDAVVHFP